MKNLETKNLKELSLQELNNVNGGNWIYDLFYALGSGSVREGRINATSVGALKYGGGWNY